MKVKVGKLEYADLSPDQINQLAFVAWHVAFPGGYDGKPSDHELQQIARDGLGSKQALPADTCAERKTA
jgi:hypothetical protein